VIVTGTAVLLGSLALGTVALRSAWSSRAGEPSADARAKGELVRRAVDKGYRDLPVRTRMDWRDVSPLVAPHIPAGTAYGFAEAILWHAGFGFTWSRQTAAKPMDENLKRCLTVAVRPLGLVADRRIRGLCDARARPSGELRHRGADPDFHPR
jgi:hypothetical protein